MYLLIFSCSSFPQLTPTPVLVQHSLTLWSLICQFGACLLVTVKIHNFTSFFFYETDSHPVITGFLTFRLFKTYFTNRPLKTYFRYGSISRHQTTSADTIPQHQSFWRSPKNNSFCFKLYWFAIKFEKN